MRCNGVENIVFPSATHTRLREDMLRPQAITGVNLTKGLVKGTLCQCHHRGWWSVNVFLEMTMIVCLHVGWQDSGDVGN
jgi:hypothetical protein